MVTPAGEFRLLGRGSLEGRRPDQAEVGGAEGHGAALLVVEGVDLDFEHSWLVNQHDRASLACGHSQAGEVSNHLNAVAELHGAAR